MGFIYLKDCVHTPHTHRGDYMTATTCSPAQPSSAPVSDVPHCARYYTSNRLSLYGKSERPLRSGTGVVYGHNCEQKGRNLESKGSGLCSVSHTCDVNWGKFLKLSQASSFFCQIGWRNGAPFYYESVSSLQLAKTLVWELYKIMMTQLLFFFL